MPQQVLPQNKPYYIFEGLQNLRAQLVCAFSMRSLWNMSLSYGDTKGSLENRNRFLVEFGIRHQDLVCAKQAHGSKIKIATEEDRGKGALTYDNAIEDTDAFITNKKNLPLAIFTADCLSIFLYDPNTASIGLIHAGWRSTKEHISDKAIRLMEQRFNTRPQDLYLGFGASIKGCCYEVGGEFIDYFSGDLLKRGSRYYLDLAKINRKQVLDAGVQEGNIFDSNICTSCKSEGFFSYRKEGRSCGRMMSVIMLR